MLDPWPRGKLVELTAEECWEVLARSSVGRIAWCADDGPHLAPLNITAHDGRVWLRTTAYSQLAVMARDRPVAIEVDEIDESSRAAVSVVVRGVASSEVPLPEGLDQLVTWVDGSRQLALSVATTEITGRRLMPS